MTRHAESTAFEQFGAAYWEDRHRNGEGEGRHEPSPSLVTLTAGLPPGRALDAGCGNGADARWLAACGWHVTAVDVSRTALRRGRRSAQAAGPASAERIEWVHADLTTWEPGPDTFDLVTSHYVHVPGPQEPLLRRLASWVSPGGTLLVVGHDGRPGHGDHSSRSARLQRGQVVASLPSDRWTIVAAESRTHTVRRPDGGGAVTLDDVVVHARRRAATRA
jgi:SAM-dependent methyltransferase